MAEENVDTTAPSPSINDTKVDPTPAKEEAQGTNATGEIQTLGHPESPWASLNRKTGVLQMLSRPSFFSVHC